MEGSTVPACRVKVMFLVEVSWVSECKLRGYLWLEKIYSFTVDNL